jgi:hypothetical protein
MRRRAAILRSAGERNICTDDIDWLTDEVPITAVLAALVADLGGRTKQEIIADLRAATRNI